MTLEIERSRLIDGVTLELWQVALPTHPTKTQVLDWLDENRERILNVVSSSGGIVIRGMSCLKDAVDFDEAIGRIAPEQLDYIGGTSPRTVVTRRIMTATDMPPRCSIPLHQEMAYTATPPDKIAFFCETPADRDGETTVTDMRKVLKRISPEFVEKCTQHGVQLRRVMPSPDALHLKPGVQKPWTEVFATQDPAEAERLVALKGWRSSWTDGGVLHVWQDLLPPTRIHPVTKEEVWSNFAHFFSPVCQMTWALEDGRVDEYEELAEARKNQPEMLDAMFFGNGEMIPDQDCLDVFRILRQSEVPLALRASDLVILDNIHYSHGRRPYSGRRRVLVSIFNQPQVDVAA